MLELQQGGEVRLVALDGDRAQLTSPVAAAPGTRFALKVDGRSIRLKVHRCVRADETFAIEGRFIDLTRDMREMLQKLITAG